MNKIRRHIIFKYLWLFMAIHILNFSIDSPDASPDSSPEDLRINDIESISELVIERILGFDNFVAEHDEQDSEQGLSFELDKIILFSQPSICSSGISFIFSAGYPSRIPIFNENLNCQFLPRIISPPPRTIS